MNDKIKLVDIITREEIKYGDARTLHNGGDVTIIGFRELPAPSTGRVEVQFADGTTMEYYPSVVNAEIVPKSPESLEDPPAEILVDVDAIRRNVLQARKARELVGKITDYVNGMSQDPRPFLAAMSIEHRTLQQSFTRLCLAWIQHVASEDYKTDPRNEASKRVCVDIVETICGNDPVPLHFFLPLV